MAELKRLFIGAKMDKDSDERFVSPGDYIDAVNIDIIQTEGGDAGVVRNKKGNTKQITKLEGVLWDINPGDPLGIGVDAECIGGVKHNPTDTIYYFVRSSTVNGIYEFNGVTKVVTPVLVDADSILDWSSVAYITGISILEGTLGFAVEDQEPCAIDIEAFKKHTSAPNTTTQINGADFKLSDVSLMRLSPKNAPGMVLNRSLRDGVIFTTIQKNFTIAQNNDGSLSEPVAAGTAVVLNLSTITAYKVGDKIKLTTQAPSSDSEQDEYEINIVITQLTIGGSVINGTVINASTLIEDNVVTWEVDLVESKPLFELQFPRFGYRWKYDNKQYSTFSPFTEVAFLPGEFLYNSQKGHNVGMTNNVRKVTLNNFDTPPNGVNKLDILYKASDSSSVYVVETLDASDTTFEITSELIWKLTEGNQILRPFDAIPKSAKALGVVANRFVLGNYKQGYEVEEANVKFEVALADSIENSSEGEAVKSIKSLRTYQGGIVYMDSMGRETPIFSDKSGVIKTTIEDSVTENKLQFQMQGDPPNFATHFKYFIKDTANGYYNLAADRLYKSEDQLATWISFPSSERNKITEETYLIAKKFHDQNKAVTSAGNRFKVVSIENNVPTEISEKKQIVVDRPIIFDSNFGDGNTQLTRNIGSTPVPNSKTFLISSDTGTAGDGVTSIMLDELIPGNWIKFKTGSSESKLYKIASVLKSKVLDTSKYYGEGDSSNVHLRVHVSEPFGEDVNFLYDDPSDPVSALTNTQVQMPIYQSQPLANQEQFTGRFFVKLASDAVLNSIFEQGEEFVTLNAANCYDGGYINGDVNFKIHAGGDYPRKGYTIAHTSGGLDVADNPSWANDDANDVAYDIVFEKRHKNPIDQSIIAAITTVGTKIRFSNHSTIYEVEQSRSQTINHNDYSYTRYWTKFDKTLTAAVSPRVTSADVVVEIVGTADSTAFTSKNPAIFETEPLENIDLNFYYEASDAFPIAEYNDLKTLDYFNCFSFGNGVESNRVRDDFNQVVIDKGPKVSTVLDDPYSEEHLPNQMIWSGLLNSTSGVNNLNQFVIAEPITKSVNPIYGSIQLLHPRDTDMVVLCEDKILQILANKDALYNADGNTNITASNAVLGDARPYVGEFGISTNPESFASYGFRAYFTDRRRGVVIRLSRDGITPIVNGYEDTLELALDTRNTIIGSFDDEAGTYNVNIGGKTHQFSETSGGWVSAWILNNEFGVTLNNVYYTAKKGILYAHDDEVNRNTWYGSGAQDSSITVVFNDGVSEIKNFLTLSYEGQDGWIASAIETDQQSGRVTTWKKREGKFYNFIHGLSTSWDNTSQSGTLDSQEFHVQGIGNLSGISGDTVQTTYPINIFDDPSDH